MCAAAAAGDGAKSALADPANHGIDRSNPQYAPSPYQEWTHAGYRNVAPSDWKGWEDLPKEYKLLPVKLDPKDVEGGSFVWSLLSNVRIAVPLGIAMAIPLFVNNIVVLDSHVELAAVFWTSMFLAQKYAGGAIKGMFLSESEATKSELLKAESDYLAALGKNIESHERLVGLPSAVRTLNAADRALRTREAAAATLRVKQRERDHMVAMLTFLTQVGSSEVEDEGASVVRTAVRTASARLLQDSAAQQAMILEAIASLQSGEVALPTAEKALDAAVDAAVAEANARAADSSAARAAEAAKLRDLFNKRFGFGEATVSEKALEKAKSAPEEWALLVAKVGGAQPTVGTRYVLKSPLDYQ